MPGSYCAHTFGMNCCAREGGLGTGKLSSTVDWRPLHHGPLR